MAKSKYTLGIHVGHDSSVALAKNGKLVAASTEEKFTRLKHYSSLPIRALEFCLKHENIGIDEISEIIIPTIGSQENVEVLLGRLKQGTVKKEVAKESKNLLDYFRYFMVGIFRLLNVWTPLVPPSYIQTYKYPKNKPLLYIEHHLAHAAAAYYTSGFQEKTLVVCADGSGDGLSTTIWLAESGRLTPVLKVGREGSFGAFYGLITEALGWWVGDGEQKTIALAAKGNTKRTKGILDKFAPAYENGKLNKGYNWGFPGIWEDKGGSHFHFSDNPKIIKLIKKYGPENIAAEAQRILEEQLVGLVEYWVKKEDVKYLAVTGGVFLNAKVNKKLWELGLLKDLYVFPDVGESGVAAGAALYGYFKDSQEVVPYLENIYLGPFYKNSEIEEILKERKISYQLLNDQDLLKMTAKLLSENKIVGWFQGRAEIGPRTLGNRSILMSPVSSGNKDILNKVKFRKEIIPLCCAIPDKSAKKYFNNLTPNSSYGLISYDLNEQQKSILPSIINEEETACPQILKRKDNPLFYDLIQAFEKLTGVPILLNTSLNISGDPVVLSPDEAIQFFYNTSLDCLVIGNYIILKK